MIWNRWPINVIIVDKNGKRLEFDRGAVETEVQTLESGQKVENKKLVLKNRKEEIPAPSFDFYWKDDKGKDNLILMEIERGILAPVLPKELVFQDAVIDIKKQSLVPIKTLIGHKYYDLYEELIKDLEIDPYTKKGFWEKYGNFIIIAIAIIGIIMVAGMVFMNINNALGSLTNMISTVAEKQVELIKALKENITYSQQLTPLR